ncbi:MAG: hypothetical protein JWN51_1390 [Phycisphaerales bacterium]|nr:hypothetical protein [Phycisphaerales bacterium]
MSCVFLLPIFASIAGAIPLANADGGHDAHLVGRLPVASNASISFSPDGTKILTAMGSVARVWDTATLKPITEPVEHDGEILTAQFTSDGKRVLIASAEEARLWDISAPLRPLLPKGKARWPAAISPDGSRVADTETDKHSNSVVVWDVPTGKPVLSLKHGGPVYCIAFSPDGGRLLTHEVDPDRDNHRLPMGAAHLWGLRTGRELIPPIPSEYKKNASYPCTPVSFSPDGNRVVVAGFKSFAVYEAATGKELCNNERFDPGLDRGIVYSLAFSPDGKKIATLAGGFARVWDAASGEPLIGEIDVISLQCAFSPDSRNILFSGVGGGVGMWNLASGKQINDFGRDGVDAVAFSPDGARVAVVHDNDPVNHGGVTDIWKVEPENERH